LFGAGIAATVGPTGCIGAQADSNSAAPTMDR
jgi:hypothetical protein